MSSEHGSVVELIRNSLPRDMHPNMTQPAGVVFFFKPGPQNCPRGDPPAPKIIDPLTPLPVDLVGGAVRETRCKFSPQGFHAAKCLPLTSSRPGPGGGGPPPAYGEPRQPPPRGERTVPRGSQGGAAGAGGRGVRGGT